MKNMNNICVYRHKRLDTDEIFYIGIGLKYRPNDIKNRNRYWNHIINKTKYKVEILFENLTWKDACELEKSLIWLYGRKDLKNGTLCNLTDGGEGSYGRKISEETRKKLSKGRFGKPGTFKGRVHSDENKYKLSQMRIGVPSYHKKVINNDKNIIYNSCTEAANDLGIDVSTLTYHLKNKKSKFNIEYYNE